MAREHMNTECKIPPIRSRRERLAGETLGRSGSVTERRSEQGAQNNEY